MAVLFGLLVFVGLILFGIGALVSSTAHGEPPALGLMLLALPLFGVAKALVDTFGARMVRGWRDGGGRGQRALASVLVWMVASAGVVGVTQLAVPNQHPDAQLVAALRPACAGIAVVGAGAVDRSGGHANHLVVLDTDGNEHPWTGYPPLEWRPASLADTELVACISAEEVETQIQVCQYVNGPPIHRYRVSRSVKIVEAATGRVLAEYLVKGDPRACGQTESRDLTELKGSLGWQDVEERCQSFVATGQAGQPTPEPGSSEPVVVPTAEPTTTVPPARRLSLTAALDRGLIDVTIAGGGLQSVDLELASLTVSPLVVLVPAGTFFDPEDDATQSMVVIGDTEFTLAPGERDSWEVPVACAEMRRDEPTDDDSFDVRPVVASGDLARLVMLERFGDEDFRVQQFAVWTITNNPSRRNYTGLGSTFSVFGTGPTADELDAIRDLFEDAGIEPSDYKAFR